MLTDEQIQILRDNAHKDLSLQEFIKLAYPDKEVDPRTKEGRSVREFLRNEKVNYKTTATLKTDEITLTESQKQLIIQEAKRSVGSYDIAKQVFTEDVIKNGVEHKAIIMFIRDCGDEAFEDRGARDYVPPKSLSRLLPKFNLATGLTFVEEKLDKNTKNRLEKLLNNLSNSRLITVANNYVKPKSRELFLDEFMRMTWDKPDLAADELNLYISISKDIVSLEDITRHIEKLNGFFDDIADAEEATIKLSDMIKSKTDEQDKIEKRIKEVTKMMNLARSNRMAERNKKSASFLAIVQAFQEEDERQTMIKMARLRNAMVKKGLDELEEMDEWRARILGIEKDDIV